MGALLVLRPAREGEALEGHATLLPVSELRYWLIDLPATIVTVWFRIYWTLVALIVTVLWTSVFLMLLLAAVGIRWGW